MLIKPKNSNQANLDQGFLGLHRLVRRLIAEDGFPDRQAAIEAISNYEHFFMAIVSHPTEPLSPSQEVDLVWQRHMLDTRIYMRDCDRLAGKYIHRFCVSPPNYFERCVQILRVSGNPEWKHPSLSYAFLNADVKTDCIPCSFDLENESMIGLVEQVQDSLQNKNSNIPWISQSLTILESDPMIVISEYKRFLRLLITGNIPLTPSKLIDEFWHQHILNSVDYFKFCIKVAGRYMHHTPHYEKPHSYHRKGFKLTQSFYKKYFDRDAPQSIWSHMGESGCEPALLYSIDSPTSVAVKLIPRMVNKDHYTQIHPIFLTKGMSMNLWRDFLRSINYVPLMSWEEYINLDKNSCFSWLEKAFFHMLMFSSLIPIALGYTYTFGFETFIDYFAYFGRLSPLTIGLYIWSIVNYGLSIVSWGGETFIPQKILKFSKIVFCVVFPFVLAKEGLLFTSFYILGLSFPLLSLLPLSLIGHFGINWHSRSFSVKRLKTIISRYTDQFAEMGIIVTQTDYRTITIEAHL
jgi:hypothetical protein